MSGDGTLRARLRARKAARALARQLAYQRGRAPLLNEHAAEVVAAKREAARRVRAAVERVRPVAADARVLEVGSGAHGHAFFFGGGRVVGVDPLAHEYAPLFPRWQRGARLVAAYGERLPFADGSFDVVLCDNVIDHAEDPPAIVRELSRVLVPAGVLYFTVHTHHPFYAAASALHTAWNAAGLRFEIRPFADHTVHLTPDAARRLFAGLPLRLVEQRLDPERAAYPAGTGPPRGPAALFKRLFFKNATYRVVAVREP